MTQVAKRDKKIAMMTTAVVCVVCVIVAFIIVLNAVIIPNGKYRDAIALLDAGNIVEAYEALVALNGYKDSAAKADAAFDKYKAEKLKAAAVGDRVFFGTYEQDNDAFNGKEDIAWLVLAKENNKILVISDKALGSQLYNTSKVNVTWENCSLRAWLNGAFLHAAFSSAEQAMIADTNVLPDKNPEYSTEPGNATMDKVFLLGINEVNQYFGSDEARRCASTAYAKANGAWTGSNYTKDGATTCWWWLRSPGYLQDMAVGVDGDGFVYFIGNPVDFATGCIRPALWINLDS